MPKRGRYYDAPTSIKSVAGLHRRALDCCVDLFRGTSNMLIASGLMQPGMFPGDDGLGKMAATFRPRGVAPAKGKFAWTMPGHLTVKRYGAAEFQVWLRVDAQERDRRLARQKALRDAGDAAFESTLSELHPDVREACRRLVERGSCWSALQWLDRDPEALGIPLRAVPAMRNGLHVWCRAIEERKLASDPSALRDAITVINRARRTTA